MVEGGSRWWEVMLMVLTNMLSRGVISERERVMSKEGWLGSGRGFEECGFDSKEDELVPKVDVSLVDGVFDGAFGGDGDEYFAIRDLEAMEEEEEEEYDEDDGENEEDDYYLIKM
ncbi:hypothetical protein Tco_0493415 [Tanacetum coccineum]